MHENSTFSNLSQLFVEILQIRHSSDSKNHSSKRIFVSTYITSKNTKFEKFKTKSVVQAEKGSSTIFDENQAFFLPLPFPKSQSSSNHLALSLESVKSHFTRENAQLVLKIVSEENSKTFSSGTVSKLKLPLSNVIQSHYIGEYDFAMDNWKPQWLEATDTKNSTKYSPKTEILARIFFVLPQDHLRLSSLKYSIGSIYTHISTKLHSFNTECRNGKGDFSILLRNIPQILDLFAFFYGVSTPRKSIASLESLLKFGETRGSLDSMIRLIQMLDDSKMNLLESSLYTKLRPSIYRYAMQLIERCEEVFPKNLPTGAFKRALHLAYLTSQDHGISSHLSKDPKSTQLSSHPSDPSSCKVSDDSSQFKESLIFSLEVLARTMFYSTIHPSHHIKEEEIFNEVNSIKIQKPKSNVSDSRVLLPSRSSLLPSISSSFSNIIKAITMMKSHVDQHLNYFQFDFQKEFSIDSVSILVDTYCELLSHELKLYFESHDQRIKKSTSSDHDSEYEENALVFKSFDYVRWIIKYWAPYTKKDLPSLLPIFDYLESGILWWLESLDAQMQLWASNVIYVDDFTPVDRFNDLLHSTSVVDLFAISHQALGVISPIFSKWTKSTVIDHLEKFIKSFCKSTVMYTANIEVEFTRQTSIETAKSRPLSSSSSSRPRNPSSAKKQPFFTPPVEMKSLFSPIAKSKFTEVLQKALRITEDPAMMIPEELRFRVTQKLCVQMNNIEAVRQLVNERADVLYDLYVTLFKQLQSQKKSNQDGNQKDSNKKQSKQLDHDKTKIIDNHDDNQSKEAQKAINSKLSSSTAERKIPTKPKIPKTGSDRSVLDSARSIQRVEKSIEERESWISDRFQVSLISIRAAGESLMNVLVGGLMPFIESNIYYIIRVHRDTDGKVRNELNRMMAKVMSKDKVSTAELDVQLAALLDFLESSLSVLSKELYYSVFKKLIKTLWNAVMSSIEDAIIPHHAKHFLRSEQIALLLRVEMELKEFLVADGEGISEALAQDDIKAHQLCMVCISKPTSHVIELMEAESQKCRELLERMLRLRAADKDKAAEAFFMQHSFEIPRK